MKKVSLIFSDIEIGSGNSTDDFIEDELLSHTIKKNLKLSEKYDLDLVFNGDIFDFLKCPYKGEFPRKITEDISVGKLESMHKAHPLFFSTLHDALKHRDNIRIIFINGNHDYDLIFERVQKRLKDLITENKVLQERILTPGFEYNDNLIHYEHGSQLDQFFSVDPATFIYKETKDPFLMLPWGFNALVDHFFPIKTEYPFLERLGPKKKVLEILPITLKKRLIFDTSWYLVKALIKSQFSRKTDFTNYLSYKEFRKYIRHLLQRKYELTFEKKARKKLLKNPFKVMVYGHNHKCITEKIKDNWILNTGPWRDEYYYIDKHFEPKKKSYGYILFDEQKVYKVKIFHVKSKQTRKSVEEIRNSLINKKGFLSGKQFFKIKVKKDQH